MRSVFPFVLVVCLFSCEPCTDCGPEAVPPTLLTTLFDVDRLTEVQDSIVLFDQIEEHTDSLLIYGDSIENFDRPYEAKKLEFENKIDALTDLRIGKTDSVFAEARDAVESLLNQNETYLKNGRTAIPDFRISQTGYQTSFDSAINQRLPLVLNDSETAMEMKVDDEQLGLVIFYTLSDELDADKRVVRRAFVESLEYSQMDSVNCYCNDEEVECSAFDCDSQNSSISCYF